MGLAASQARLLTITSRKADCEYQSMALSHQKIALSRDMSNISEEYQNALNQTKLVWDYYGTGDTGTQLSYSLLMNPSQLNNYMPSPITDQSGRVVLDAKLAAAAKAAGIPQEGLGTTPSSDIRNRFIQSLADNEVISQTTADGIMSVSYNPDAGLGSTDLITVNTQTVTWDEFLEMYGDLEYDFSDVLVTGGVLETAYLYDIYGDTTYKAGDSGATLTLNDILNGNYGIYATQCDSKDAEYLYGGRGCIIDVYGSCSYWDMLYSLMSSVIDPNDSQAQAALDYAYNKTMDLVQWYGPGDNQSDNEGTSNAAYVKRHKGCHRSSTILGECKSVLKNKDYVGYTYDRNDGDELSHYNDGYSLNLTNMTNAFFTYFAMYMEGMTTTDYSVASTGAASNFVDGNFTFNIVTSVDTSGDTLLIANFYDTLFNQIAVNGWVENENVDDNEYLQTMLQNGSMYISTIGDDDYYYQSNYATNSYIKEVTDEEGIAQAEAKYNNEKAKINYKENIIDMKMNNLDTEISSLTTEYDSVKSIISKNIEKGFTRYQA